MYVWCYISDLIPTDVLLGMDFLRRNSIIDLRRRLMLLDYYRVDNCSVKSMTKIRDTGLFEEDFPTLASIPNSDLPWKRMILDWIVLRRNLVTVGFTTRF